MRTAINFISWGVFLMLVSHMVENRPKTKAKDQSKVNYAQVINSRITNS